MGLTEELRKKSKLGDAAIFKKKNYSNTLTIFKIM